MGDQLLECVLMIAFLKGRIIGIYPNSIVLDVNGVGYEVVVDRQTIAGLRDRPEEISLHIRTVVREDAITLYGFETPLSRDVFDRLTRVDGVGPKLALVILGGMPLDDLIQAIRDKDIRALTSIPGVGRKTAERVILELRDFALTTSVETKTISSELLADLRSALSNLGFSSKEIEGVTKNLKPEDANRDFEDILRQVLASRMR